MQKPENPSNAYHSPDGGIDYARYEQRARDLRSQALMQLLTGRGKDDKSSSVDHSTDTRWWAGAPCPAK